jgi:Zn-dependent protease
MPLDTHAILLLLSVLAPPVIIAITTHEASHGFIAWKCGDDTAYQRGRVTFNPLKHIDAFGTIILPAMMFVSFGGMFGYAKPVPINPNRFHHYRRDYVLVAAGGPGSNIVLAIASALLLNLVPHEAQDLNSGNLLTRMMYEPLFSSGWLTAWISAVLVNSITINVVLAIFNMLPMLPLDGGRVVAALLPQGLSRAYARTERFGMLVLLALILLPQLLGNHLAVDINILGWILGPASRYVRSIIGHLAGLGDALTFID